MAESAPVEPAPSAAAPETVVATPLTPVAAPAPAVSSAARGEMAHVLESIVAENRDGHVEIALLGDGWFTPRDFVLANPPRIVLDLPGVKNEVRQRAIAVKGELVSRVRVSQFQTSPEYVTRVVVDLSRPMPHTIVPDGERLAVVIGADVVRAEAAPAATTRWWRPPRRSRRNRNPSPSRPRPRFPLLLLLLLPLRRRRRSSRKRRPRPTLRLRRSPSRRRPCPKRKPCRP